MKLDLLTNTTVVDDAIRFVSSQKLKLLSNSNEHGEESKDRDDDPKEQLEKEQVGETTGEITAATINEVF
jgi:hypothetical protein